MRTSKKSIIIVFIMLFGVSVAQQFENGACDLGCMEEAFELTDPIAEGGDYEQAYEHFEAIYNHCTATYC